MWPTAKPMSGSSRDGQRKTRVGRRTGKSGAPPSRQGLQSVRFGRFPFALGRTARHKGADLDCHSRQDLSLLIWGQLYPVQRAT
jgi:hypothetical protein